MRELNLGPVAHPDGTPTDLTREMLAGTGRDPVAFARLATMKRTCPECGRVFDLTNGTDADELAYGHDCEAGS